MRVSGGEEEEEVVEEERIDLVGVEKRGKDRKMSFSADKLPAGVKRKMSWLNARKRPIVRVHWQKRNGMDPHPHPCGLSGGLAWLTSFIGLETICVNACKRREVLGWHWIGWIPSIMATICRTLFGITRRSASAFS
jgi:hypothetical protein